MRASLFALCLLGAGSLTAHVQAHSQPGVYSILDEDASGVHLLRLYQGLVQRDGDKWRFVCSKTYGGQGQDLAGALPGGGAAIALPMGIAIMKRDGTITPHPDPEAQNGLLTAFARTDDKLYALRWRDRLKVTDVVEVSDTTVRVLWTDTHYWSDIAAGGQSIALVRSEGDQIEDLRLSFDGQVLSEDKASLVDPLEISVRVMGDVPYYAARLQNQRLLGRIENGEWHTVLMAGNALAGPLELADGTALVALDGVLSTFANDAATPLADAGDFVTGLAQLAGHPYALTSTGLRDLSSTGLGDPLFDMSELLGPNECVVPDASRNDCEIEWQHLLIELIGANIAIATDDPSLNMCPTAGATGAITADSGMAGASAANTGGGAGAAAGAGAAGAAGSPPNDDSAGMTGGQHGTQASSCACGIVPRAPRAAAGFVYTVLVASGLFLRRRRKYADR
ncbi:MAG TPA: hypothetical protein VFN67_31495 [Polyangiales bacterium]|nr:hypothetical protein [Polyangiales bacterium]